MALFFFCRMGTPNTFYKVMLVDTVDTVPLLQCNIYWLQTKFAKVMFLHLSFCSGGGKYLGRYPPGQVHPHQVHSLGKVNPPPPGRYIPRQVYPQVDAPSQQVHLPGRYALPPGRYALPPGRYTPGRYTPPVQCMLRDTGNKHASTHPIGMQSYVTKYYILVHVRYQKVQMSPHC